jgi:hypothetical protein
MALVVTTFTSQLHGPTAGGTMRTTRARRTRRSFRVAAPVRQRTGRRLWCAGRTSWHLSRRRSRVRCTAPTAGGHDAHDEHDGHDALFGWLLRCVRAQAGACRAQVGRHGTCRGDVHESGARRRRPGAGRARRARRTRRLWGWAESPPDGSWRRRSATAPVESAGLRNDAGAIARPTSVVLVVFVVRIVSPPRRVAAWQCGMPLPRDETAVSVEPASQSREPGAGPESTTNLASCSSCSSCASRPRRGASQRGSVACRCSVT